MKDASNNLPAKYSDLIIGGILLLTAVVFYIFTFRFSGYEFETVPNDMGPKFMPRLILFALALESIVLISLNIVKSGQQSERPTPSAPIFQKRPFIMLGTFLLYIFVTPFLGYIASTIVFMIVAFLLLGVRNKWAIIFTPPLVTVATYYLFGTLLNIYLPSGEFF